MKTSHTLQVTAHPYSLGSPRYYHAKNYSVGDTVINSGEQWIVKEINGLLMFVNYEGEDQLIRMAKAGVLKPSHKVRKVEGKLAGYIPVLKYDDKIVWQAKDEDWCMWRNQGNDSAEQHARWKIRELKAM